MANFIKCMECNKPFDVDAEGIRENYIDVCPMDTGDAGMEIQYQCPHCGWFNVYCYAEQVDEGDV